MVFFAGAASAQTVCRQALALGLDVSRSVDATEYRLQLDGLAAALGDRDVRAAILLSPESPVYLFVYEWSDPSARRVLVPWSAITSAAALDEIRARLQATQRGGENDSGFSADTPGRIGARSGSTGLGQALAFAVEILDGGPPCWRKTLDISGDGPSNAGPDPAGPRAELAKRGVTVNALVVGSDSQGGDDQRQAEIKQLLSYFHAQVLTGPDAFAEVALGYSDYANAMRRKLLKELQIFILGEVPRRPPLRAGFPQGHSRSDRKTLLGEIEHLPARAG